MRILITLISIFILFNFGLTITSYDRQQDKIIQLEQIKTIALQGDVNALKIKTVDQEKRIISLELSNGKQQQKLDSMKVFIVKYSQKFIVTPLIKDTVYIDIR